MKSSLHWHKPVSKILKFIEFFIKFPNIIETFWSIKNLICQYDILFYKKRVRIPDCLKDELLVVIDQSQHGIVSCKQRAQDSIYFPGLTNYIEKMLLCAVSAVFARSNQRACCTTTSVSSKTYQRIPSWNHME